MMDRGFVASISDNSFSTLGPNIGKYKAPYWYKGDQHKRAMQYYRTKRNGQLISSSVNNAAATFERRYDQVRAWTDS
jgi:hypothetical protein